MRSRKGFTLIELLAVIVIIAIIALIGIPSVTNIINNSRKDSLKSTALAMSNAARNALAANNVAVPYNAAPASGNGNGCYILWPDLSMESSTLPVGNAVDETTSGVWVKTNVAGDKNTYTIFLVNVAGDTGVSGIDSSALDRDDVKIGDATTMGAMFALETPSANTGWAEPCF